MRASRPPELEHPHRISALRNRGDAFGVIGAHEERDLRPRPFAQRLRHRERPVDVAHAHDAASVDAEEDPRLAQEALGHPEVLEVVDRETLALVEGHEADRVAEARVAFRERRGGAPRSRRSRDRPAPARRAGRPGRRGGAAARPRAFHRSDRSEVTETTAVNRPVAIFARASSMLRAERKGVVAWRTTTTSARGWPFSDSNTACRTTGIRLERSPESSFGRRKGTSAPCARATSATVSSSVDTMIRSMSFASFAARMVWARRGASPRRLMLR